MRKNFFRYKKPKIHILPYAVVLSGLFIIFVMAYLLYHGNILAKTDEATGDLARIERISVATSVAPSTTIPTGTPAIDMEKDDRVIVIDAGHGGVDVGGISNGIVEKDINLSIANKLKEILKEKNYHVVMTRSDDSFLSKSDRAEMANNLNADAFISIHQNIYGSADVHGIETWYDDSNIGVDNYNLAKFIHTKTLEKTKAKDREIMHDSEFYVTRETTMPSCLIETGFMSNASELSMLKNPKYQSKIANGIAEGIDLFFNPKTMYITFDDGPSADNTNDILRILRERNIKATFFVVGKNVQKNPELARKIVEEGHTIGLHSYTHDYKEIYASKESFFKDFDKAYHTIVDVTGIEPNLFRFPGGSVNSFNKSVHKEIIKELNKRGIVYFDWNASLEDATRNPVPDTLIQNAIEGSANRNNVILLAHETVSVTANILNDIIDQFPEYYMKNLTPETKPIQFRLN